MNPSRGPDFVSNPKPGTARLRGLLRFVELVVSIALAIAPLSLTAFATLSGA